jgi:hypothetical protein
MAISGLLGKVIPKKSPSRPGVCGTRPFGHGHYCYWYGLDDWIEV